MNREQRAVIAADRRNHGGVFQPIDVVPAARIEAKIHRPAGVDGGITDAVVRRRHQAAAAQVAIDDAAALERHGLTPDSLRTLELLPIGNLLPLCRREYWRRGLQML